MVRSSFVGELLALLAVPARLAAPGKSFDDIGVQIHTLTVNHEFAVGALK